MIAPLNRWLPLALVVLAAFWLRVHDLARRPMHADEANQAVKAGQLLDQGGYVFDAQDHHGPTLYYAALPIAWARGQHTLAALDETTVRLVPALAGTLGVFLLAVLAAPLGRWPALAAAAFMAVSPPAVYYSRYFVQETLLVTLTLSAFVCGQRWWRGGGVAWAAGAGASVGLMLATKESALLFLAVAAVALIAMRLPRPSNTGFAREVLLAAGVAAVVAAAFYSSFGTHLAGVRDAAVAVVNGVGRATGPSGHEKPWWYYARLFAWQRSGGVAFEQVAFSLLALVGAFFGCRSLLGSEGLKWHGRLARTSPDPEREARASNSPAGRLLCGAATYAIAIAVVLSLTPYKTPWHAVQFVPAMALLAAGALAAVPVTWLAVVVAVGALAMQVYQTNQVAFVYAAAERNPYAYVHSSTDVLKFRGLAEAAVADSPDRPVLVISEEYWPLPWYFRGLPEVGYWPVPPETCDGALVVASASLAGAVRARLHGAYRESFLGLRPGFVCVVFTPSP